MRSVLIDGYEYPENPPHRPKGLDDVRALEGIVASMKFCRSQVGFHERSLYRQICRLESMVRKRLEGAREARGQCPKGTRSAQSLLSE